MAKKSTRNNLKKFERPILDLEKFAWYMQNNYFAFFDFPNHVFANDMYENGKGYGKSVIHHINSNYMITWKHTGKMFAYDYLAVPIQVRIVNYKTEGTVLNFVANTMDDYHYSFWYKGNKNCGNEEMMVVIKNWLNSIDEMPSEKEFEKFFRKQGIEEFSYS